MRNLKHLLNMFGAVMTVFAILVLVGGAMFWQSGKAQAATLKLTKHSITVHPLVRSTSKAGPNPDKLLFTCQLPNAPFRCYSPQQIATAYSFKSLYKSGITGKGRTIIIVDAYQSPTIVSDLQGFDATFSLPDPKLNIIAPLGLTKFDPTDPTQVGWSQEITLDVEWAHAIAPGAIIDLVLAPSSMEADLLAVTKYAVDHNLGDVISQSFGGAESCADPALLVQQHKVFVKAAAKHITVLASAGDRGAAQPTCDGSSFFLSASYPASDPYVTAVGGTQLFATAKGAYRAEIVWNETDLNLPFNIGGGGGFSTIYAKPDYQDGVVPGKTRGVPDVAYDAAVNGGVLIDYNGSFPQAGGTSAGTPQWAGLVALANQYQGKRVGFLNPTIYSLGQDWSHSQVFHDIIAGNNSFFTLDHSFSIRGYSANYGWDAASGFGSPIASGLVPKL